MYRRSQQLLKIPQTMQSFRDFVVIRLQIMSWLQAD